MTDHDAVLDEIVVRRLFGRRDYSIKLEGDQPTVLTGGNGTGKSTILRLVDAASTGDLRVLTEAPVDAFELRFHRLPTFVMQRIDPVTVRCEWGDNATFVTVPWAGSDLPRWATDVLWLHANRDGANLHEALDRAAREFGGFTYDYWQARDKALSLARPIVASKPDFFEEFGKAFPVLFVTDQRLVVEGARRVARVRGAQHTPGATLAVRQASSFVADQIQMIDSEYTRASLQQDKRFPQAVIRQMSTPTTIALEDLKSLISEVRARRDSLKDVGLLDGDEGYEPTLNDDDLTAEPVRQVMETFLRSTLIKLRVFDGLEVRLRAFKAFLEDRFSGKSVDLSRENGVRFRLVDQPPFSGSEWILPDQLSSGEQQMMVLAYEILFRARPNTLVIVDEPEISLHVVWQDTLIANLDEMGAAGSLQFLMATHSPALIASRPEIERSLDILDR